MEANYTISGSTGSETNSGFLHELILVDVDDIMYLLDPEIESDVAFPFTLKNESIGIKETALVYKMKFRTKTCIFSETQSLIPEGQAFTLSISWDFAKNKQDVLSFVWTNSHKRWLALFKDTNGTCYVAGDMENGLLLTMGRSINAQNMITLQLTGRNWHPVWFVESMNVLDSSDPEFDNSFDFSFKS